MPDTRRLRVLATLLFLWKKLPQHRGFFYHFANMNTGERVWDSEVSSVDTAILLCGALTCREYREDVFLKLRLVSSRACECSLFWRASTPSLPVAALVSGKDCRVVELLHSTSHSARWP